MEQALADMKARGLWKDGDANLEERALDPRTQEALNAARNQIWKDQDASLKAIEEKKNKRLLEAGHQILILGKTDWTPAQSKIEK
jgi:hypothetical protein